MTDHQARDSASQYVGVWSGDGSDTNFLPLDAGVIQASIRSSTCVVLDSKTHRIGLASQGEVHSVAPLSKTSAQQYPLLGILPPMYPEWLGDRGFQETHRVRFAYVGGAMARGIGSAKLVIELGQMGAMGMFGSAGLSPEVVEA
ncbi:MAG TPA: 2-nitropropane dioxygenase, partial [Pseudomonadales bacterium]|nr:2-nitropropane dioxygenase [Pseudomonadales bacterium]